MPPSELTWGGGVSSSSVATRVISPIVLCPVVARCIWGGTLSSSSVATWVISPIVLCSALPGLGVMAWLGDDWTRMPTPVSCSLITAGGGDIGDDYMCFCGVIIVRVGWLMFDNSISLLWLHGADYRPQTEHHPGVRHGHGA